MGIPVKLKKKADTCKEVPLDFGLPVAIDVDHGISTCLRCSGRTWFQWASVMWGQVFWPPYIVEVESFCYLGVPYFRSMHSTLPGHVLSKQLSDTLPNSLQHRHEEHRRTGSSKEANRPFFPPMVLLACISFVVIFPSRYGFLERMSEAHQSLLEQCQHWFKAGPRKTWLATLKALAPDKTQGTCQLVNLSEV